MANREARPGILQGTLDLMVLQTLASMGPQHGYSIAARIEQASDRAIEVNMGTLYPALMRLEQRGFLKGKWDVSDNNRKARFYSLTASGRKQLDIEKAGWAQTAGTIQRLLSEETS
ncbi:MAG TPA: PadR family transcriptional regulator [Bryobacteraceae bacterium]|nr:PadR family transcriptional regulator [Bryobacteraceae bacterium]